MSTAQEVESQASAVQEGGQTQRTAAANVPPEVLQAIYGFGVHKSHEKWWVLCLQAFQAGCFKSIACQLYLTVGGGILGAVLFPVGLIAILLTGAELFTSDTLFMTASFLGGKIKYPLLARNMAISWIFNFIGCLYWAAFMAYWSGQIEDAGAVDFAIETAEKKALQPWYQIFLKGIGANFLIALAVWQSTASGDVAGKILGIWFPVMAFVELGFDHCVANMFWIPLGMWYGANVDVVQLLFLALLPATLGNMFGGGIGMGVVYWFLYDSLASGEQFRRKVAEALKYHPTIIPAHRKESSD